MPEEINEGTQSSHIGTVGRLYEGLPRGSDSQDAGLPSHLYGLAAVTQFIQEQPRGTVLAALRGLPPHRFLVYALSCTIQEPTPGTERVQKETFQTLRLAFPQQLSLQGVNDSEKRALLEDFYTIVSKDEYRLIRFFPDVEKNLQFLPASTKEAIARTWSHSLVGWKTKTMARILSNMTIADMVWSVTEEKLPFLSLVAERVQELSTEMQHIKTGAFIPGSATEQEAAEILSSMQNNDNLDSQYRLQRLQFEDFFQQLLRGRYGALQPQEMITVLDSLAVATVYGCDDQWKRELQSTPPVDWGVTDPENKQMLQQQIQENISRLPRKTGDLG